MKLRMLPALAAPALLLGIAACDIEQTREGEAPEVEVEEGRLPQYDVDLPDVDIRRDTQEVVVPRVDIRRDTSVQR